METSRHQVADLINADPKEIIFTSGATESNNISVKGVARLDILLAKLTPPPSCGSENNAHSGVNILPQNRKLFPYDIFPD